MIINDGRRDFDGKNFGCGFNFIFKNLDHLFNSCNLKFCLWGGLFETGRPPEIDLNLEKQVHAFLREVIKQGIINSAHDLGDGGLAVAIAECCISSGYGANIMLPPSESRLDRLWFAEGGARVLVSCSADQSVELKKYYKNISLQGSNLFSISHLGNVNNQKKLLVSQSNNTIIDV